MAAKKNPAGELAEKMVRVLEAQRNLGGASYPLTLRRLAEISDPAAPAELVLQAASKRKPFGERVVAIRTKDLNAPLALVEDVAQVTGGSLTLLFLLNSLCSTTSPTCDAAMLKKIIAPKLRASFEAALNRRIAEGELPAGVCVIVEKKKKLLYLEKYPPPPAAEVVLARALKKNLEAQRQAGNGAYPLTLALLAETTQPNTKPALLQAALAQSDFADHVIFALPKNRKLQRLESPLALSADRDVLASSPLLLETAIALSRTNDTQLVAESDLKKKLNPDLFDSFRQALAGRVQSKAFPPGIGCLLQKKKPLLFLLSDVPEVRVVSEAMVIPAPTPQPRPTPPIAPSRAILDFARLFDEAFDRLERERGHNFVNLVDLRRVLATDRETFDAGLQGLRRAGRYTLSGAEGRDGISPEENQAGIREEGSLLLYVSRRLS